MRIKRLIFIVPLYIFAFSCTNNNDKNVYDVVIDKKIKPLPPLPLPRIGDLTTKIPKALIDSINKVELDIAVHPFKIDFILDKEYEIDFKDLGSISLDYFSSKIKVRQADLFGRESLNFKIVSEPEFNSESIYDKFDGVLQVSTIKYNNDKSEAIIIISYSVAKLSNSTLMYFLKKENNSWNVKEIKSLSVS